MTDEEKMRKQVWDGVKFKDALRDVIASAATGYPYKELVKIIKKEDNEDGLTIEELEDVDKTVNVLAHLFTHYGTKRIGEDFEKFKMHEQLAITGALIHRLTAGFPDGAGFADIKLERSDWQCFLVKKGAGFENEVTALLEASED